MSEAEPIRRKGITLGVQRRMSPEDLATEDARVIEDNFPKHRTLHLKPNDGAIQRGTRIEIVVTEEVLLATAHHVARDTSKESGGFLLGNRYVCPNTNRQYIMIDQFMKADYTEGTQVSLTFTTNSWAQLKDRMGGKYLGKTLVGWYHSHPAMGIFLSNYDLDIHKNRFANEWDVALVLDPVKHEGGFFAWIDGNVNPREKLDFYELLDGDSRETVVAWTNYTAEDPKTGIPAPLKAVNTQNSDGNPAAAVSTTSKKPTVAAGGGLLSNPIVILGGAAVLALFLLVSLFAGYWLWTKSSPAESNSNTESQPVKNKVLNAEKITVGKDLKGYVSSENKIIVDLQITGIDDDEALKQILKDNNLQIEINAQPAKITESSVVNGVVLKVRAETDLTAEATEAFNANKWQDFVMSVDIYYNGDFVPRKVKTNYQKGKGNNSLGDNIVFGEKPIDIIDTNRQRNKPSPDPPSDNNPTQKTPKPNVSENPIDTNPAKRKTPNPTQNPTKTATPKRGTAIGEGDNPATIIKKETDKAVETTKKGAIRARRGTGIQ